MRNPAGQAFTIVASALLLASCGGTPEQPQAKPGATLPSQAEIAGLQGEGLLKVAREASQYELWAHYRLMQATGVDKTLGGDDKAVAALTAVSASLDRTVAAARTDVPRLLPASFDGTGLAVGVVGVGYGLVGGALSSGMLNQLSNEEVVELAKKGPIKDSDGDGSGEVGVSQAGVDTALEQTVNEDGLTGTVKTRIHLDACPAADGKLTVTIDSESTMSAGGKGGTVKIRYRRERWLTDDAKLGDGAAEDFQVDMSGTGSSSNKLAFAERITVSRDGQVGGGVTGQQGFDIFHLDDTKHTEALRDSTLRLMRLVADAMLIGMGKDPPYQNGRCIDLQVHADPAKRSRARPSTAYTLFANPRARLDGVPAGGTVTATLDGESTLNPTTKVRADARFDYANPAKKDQQASVAFESRSRRGVGRATLDFDTRAGGYHIAGGQNDLHIDQVVCSLTEFDLRSSIGLVMHMKGGDDGGRWTVSGNAGGVSWSGGGTYTFTTDGGLRAAGQTTIATPRGRFSDSVTPTFTVTPVDADCGSG